MKTLEQNTESLEQGMYQSERHREMVEDFMRKDMVVECLHSTADACYPQCPRFYDCWVEESE